MCRFEASENPVRLWDFSQHNNIMRKFINEWLLIELVFLVGTTTYLILNWNESVTVGTGAISLLWVEIVYLIYLNLKERE